MEADSLEAGFARAAAGTFASFVPGGTHPIGSSVEVEVEAIDLEELVVAWLEELLYRSATQDILFAAFEVDSVSQNAVRGRATGRSRVPDEELAGPEVKGVTRHGLRLEERDGSWHLRVYLDV